MQKKKTAFNSSCNSVLSCNLNEERNMKYDASNDTSTIV